VLASQNGPGYPSVKFWSVSSDHGQTWSPLAPLTDEEGHFVYSCASMPEVFLSTKNQRVYLLLNVTDEPVYGWDPRTHLYIAEVNPSRCCLIRKKMALVEAKHEEHHDKVRFSNWAGFEDRTTGNRVLFMPLQMSECCPIRNGYDCGSYRYEIELPD
jgi:hypothetical protein